MKVKICGITTLQDAQLALKAGAWSLGFNFYKNSPRYIEPNQAKRIISALPAETITVGVFVEENATKVEEIMQTVGLSLAQVYRHFPNKKKKIYVLRPRNLQEVPPLEILHQYEYVLIDAASGEIGGSGQLANWKVAAKLSKACQLILAGGLKPDNVKEAIRLVKPAAVDVCTGIESMPGRKDPQLLNQFIAQARYI